MDRLELIPGVVSKPFFESEEDYLAFRDRFEREVTPALNEQRRQRALSEEDARHHYVD